MAVGVVLAALVVAGIVAVSTTGGSAPDELSGRTDAPAPGFSLPALGDPSRTVALAQLTGKDLVLNFWASWCYPCQQEMPALETAWSRSRGKVQFVGIDTSDARSAALAFLHRVKVTYPTLFDPTARVAGELGLFGLPTTVFVSPAGRVLGRHSGQLDTTTLEVAMRQAFGAAAP